MIVYRCPKCKQQDKGFSKQDVVATDIDNLGRPTGEPLELGVPLYYCLSEGCDGIGSYSEVIIEVHPNGTTS